MQNPLQLVSVLFQRDANQLAACTHFSFRKQLLQSVLDHTVGNAQPLQDHYERQLDWCFDHLKLTLGLGVAALSIMLFIGFGGVIGSEFLPHLDEGAVWVRGTLAPSTGFSAGIDLANRARRVLADFPEAKQVVSQVGRPDDGSDASGFYNTKFFVDLLPRAKWRSDLHTKDELIAAMDKELNKFPGVDWNLSQPISDNAEEAAPKRHDLLRALLGGRIPSKDGGAILGSRHKGLKGGVAVQRTKIVVGRNVFGGQLTNVD
jgi:multidrug efflux pump subunit AcrB